MAGGRAFEAGRRRALAGLAALGAPALAGCACWFRREPLPTCPTSPEISLPNGPLTIDAHCHVFNGTDLQIKAFLSKVAVRQRGALGAGATVLGSILQELAWSIAPDGEAELAELRHVEAVLRQCSADQTSSKIASLRQSGYSQGRAQLQAAVRRSNEFRALRERLRINAVPPDIDAETRAKVNAMRVIDTLPQDVEAYRVARTSRAMTARSVQDRSASGLIDFVLQNFQYRYVSVHDYLHTYNQPGKRVVDLMLPSLVDYDWWLAKGVGTLTPLRTQVGVMREIAILTGGRVHGFVPFDPLRQVALRLGHGGDDSLGLVKDAVVSQGCVGVKLYPPMGFAPLGNADLMGTGGSGFWARDWLPAWTARQDLGELLDSAMRELLGWCEAEEVPVMAHTSLSNGVSKDFEALAGSPYWAKALAAFPKLRVSFGHFGDSSIADDGLERARAFAGLMNAGIGQPGTGAYADAGYFVEVIAREPALRDQLRMLYDETADKGDAALANRFMYGTDWEMTLTEGSVDSYLSQFVELLEELQVRPTIRARGLRNLSSKFFGANAAEWLGLRKGRAARTRLDAFYRSHGVADPDWALKIDSLI